MKERPILFSAPMVRAIHRKLKRQTRRIMKPEAFRLWDKTGRERDESGWPLYEDDLGDYHKLTCPYGQPGDRLWVKETSLYKSECGEYLCRLPFGESWGNFEAWTADGKTHWLNDDRIKTWDDREKHKNPLPYCVGGYSAEMTGQKKDSFTLTLLQCDPSKEVEPFTGNTIIEKRYVVFRRRVPSIFMPRWASRITLEITDVRIERLQEISEENAKAEGVEPRVAGQSEYGPIKQYRTGFVYAWGEINGKDSWLSNPWVWVVSFRDISAEA
jgi:hypothetical protein